MVSAEGRDAPVCEGSTTMQPHTTGQRLSLTGRSMVVHLMLGMLLLLMVTSGCSHTKPYMRPTVPQPDPKAQLQYRILLFGDGGEPACNTAKNALDNDHACVKDLTLQTLVSRASANPQQTTILFLGDNIYPEGLPEEREQNQYAQARQRLDAQIATVKDSNAEGIFIPGNHDWQRGKNLGLEAIQRQEKYVNGKFFEAKVRFLPRGGQPGPVIVDKDGIRIVILDTQWWLHEQAKPQHTTPDIILKTLRAAISSAPTGDVMVVAHHPLQSYGPHGGFFDWQDHLFPLTALDRHLWIPLPIIGSLYPLGRRYLWRNVQDLDNRKNRDMVRKLTTTLRTKKPLIYASGHEHSLQVLKGSDSAHSLLVSGAGSKTTKVSHGPETFFAHEHRGFMEVDFLLDGSVFLRVVEPREGTTAGFVVFAQWLREP